MKASMKSRLSDWNSAEFLEGRDAVIAYIEAAFEDGDSEIIKHALGVVARSKGMTQIASETGLSREGLYKALKPDGDPKLSTFLGVLKALGMKMSAKAA
jgi:probable addiction module antidote protein